MTKKDDQIIKNAEEKNIPIFVLVAKDKLSRRAIAHYLCDCLEENCSEEHSRNVRSRLIEFKEWQDLNPDQVKKPD
jgi:hypothetical protein